MKLDFTTESTLLNWIGKEKDNESKLGDHGVRKYEYQTGRFISIDPLWANYFGWTLYKYSGNNPINRSDLNGKEFKAKDQESHIHYETTFRLGFIGTSLSIWKDMMDVE